MHTKICYLCHNSTLSPQMPSLPKLVLADLWGKKTKTNQTNKPETKKTLLAFVYFCCSLQLKKKTTNKILSPVIGTSEPSDQCCGIWAPQPVCSCIWVQYSDSFTAH